MDNNAIVEIKIEKNPKTLVVLDVSKDRFEILPEVEVFIILFLKQINIIVYTYYY